MSPNRFAVINRQRKIDALLAAIPHPTDDIGAQRVANTFEAMPLTEWADFAKRRGINAPSAFTVERVVTALRARVGQRETAETAITRLTERRAV